ncbi:uncharacterized protein LOC144303432 isoform X1 [Canis aureus]
MLEQGFSRTFVNVSGEQSHRWSAGCKSKAFQQIHGQRTAQRLRHKAFQTQVMTTPCPPEPTLGKAAHRLTAPKCARQAPASVLMATGTFPLQPIPAPGCPASAASQLRLADDKRPRIQARRPLSVPLPALPPSLQNSFLSLTASHLSCWVQLTHVTTTLSSFLPHLALSSSAYMVCLTPAPLAPGIVHRSGDADTSRPPVRP